MGFLYAKIGLIVRKGDFLLCNVFAVLQEALVEKLRLQK